MVAASSSPGGASVASCWRACTGGGGAPSDVTPVTLSRLLMGHLQPLGEGRMRKRCTHEIQLKWSWSQIETALGVGNF